MESIFKAEVALPVQNTEDESDHGFTRHFKYLNMAEEESRKIWNGQKWD